MIVERRGSIDSVRARLGPCVVLVVVACVCAAVGVSVAQEPRPAEPDDEAEKVVTFGEPVSLRTTLEGVVRIDGAPAPAGSRLLMRTFPEREPIEPIAVGEDGAYRIDLKHDRHRILPVRVELPGGAHVEGDPDWPPIVIDKGDRKRFNVEFERPAES